MTEDISPALLESIRQSFQAAFDRNTQIQEIYQAIEAGAASYAQANEFAVCVGEMLAAAFREHLSSAILPDGRMYYNIAQSILTPTFRNNYDLITEVTTSVQEALNAAAGLGLKAQVPAFNQDRLDGIINRVSSEENFDDVAWILQEPTVNFSQSIVDDSIRVNAEFQAGAGLSPKIVRRMVGGCCKWCRALAGTYTYPDVPKDVYRRHENCRCTVEYDPGSGKRQNVHTKQWTTAGERAKIEARKTVGLNDIVSKLVEHPARLASYTPQTLKDTLEAAGYEVKPLSQGALRGISFENGGGFKVNFPDGGLIQYHPAYKSHHGGEYYKISTGKGGTKHYELDGTEKPNNRKKR